MPLGVYSSHWQTLIPKAISQSYPPSFQIFLFHLSPLVSASSNLEKKKKKIPSSNCSHLDYLSGQFIFAAAFYWLSPKHSFPNPLTNRFNIGTASPNCLTDYSALFCASKCSPLWTESLEIHCHLAYNYTLPMGGTNRLKGREKKVSIITPALTSLSG